MFIMLDAKLNESNMKNVVSLDFFAQVSSIQYSAKKIADKWNNKICFDVKIMGSCCGSVVEHTPLKQEVMGSNLTRFWDFSFINLHSYCIS